MILVAVGGHTAPFDRLIQRMDVIAQELDEDVFMQIGSATVTPKHSAYRRFMARDEFGMKQAEARVVVSHAGIGILLECARLSKPTLFIPRLRRYREASDDHQLEMCVEMSRAGALTYLVDTSSLSRDKIDGAAPPRLPNHQRRPGERILRFLRDEDGGN